MECKYFWQRVLIIIKFRAMLTIPDGPFAAYIFDCDGTLADSMPLHFRAWQRALEDHRAPYVFPEEQFYRYGGIPTPKIIEMLNEEHGASLDPHSVSEYKENCYLEILSTIRPVAAVANFARQAAATHPVAVASGGFRHVVEETLRLVGLEGLFPVIVTTEDVAHGKPSPDIFLLAARRLGVEPGGCLVFEDGDMGIEAARRAGMRWLDVRTHSRAAA